MVSACSYLSQFDPSFRANDPWCGLQKFLSLCVNSMGNPVDIFLFALLIRGFGSGGRVSSLPTSSAFGRVRWQIGQWIKMPIGAFHSRTPQLAQMKRARARLHKAENEISNSRGNRRSCESRIWSVFINSINQTARARSLPGTSAEQVAYPRPWNIAAGCSIYDVTAFAFYASKCKWRRTVWRLIYSFAAVFPSNVPRP